MLVQLGLKKILEAVYEPRVGTEIVGYYIQDPNILNLIKKYLKAGILEEGEYKASEEGSIQGIISPVLANIYMHHVLVLWYKAYFEKRGNGQSFLVVYADDFIAGFENESEARRYYQALQERLSKYGLEIEPSKSRLLEFGRYAKERRIRRGLGKPETFDFLGFTFYCGETLEGKFCVIPKTNSKKFRMKLKEMNQWLKEHRNLPLKELMPKLNQKLVGHYRYYGVTYNIKMLIKYHYYVVKLLFKWLNRRSNKELHVGAIPHDADLLSNSPAKEVCKPLWLVTVNVVMKSRMRKSRTYGSVRNSHREV